MYGKEEGKSCYGIQIQNDKIQKLTQNKTQISVNRMQNVIAAVKPLVVRCTAKNCKRNNVKYTA